MRAAPCPSKGEKLNRRIRVISPGAVAVDETDYPSLSEGNAVLQVLYGGICGSDLNTYRGSNPYVSYPRTPGHELAAKVVEVGENPHGIRPGMLVTVNPYFNCGKCFPCRNGRVNCCVSNETMGVQREGGFAQFISMPLERIYPGGDLSAEALVLVEPFCISSHGVELAGIGKGRKVLVVGAGTIGIMAMLLAKAKGAEVYVCDVAPEKLALAERLGVSGTILNDHSGRFADQVADITGGDGFAVTMEAVGKAETFQMCVDAAAFSGKVVLYGVANENLDFNFTLIQKKELIILGSRNAVKADFHDVMEMMAATRFAPESLVSAAYPVDEAASAFSEFARRAGKMLKVLIRFS